jgi:arginyl-tRNA synthetase
MASNGHSLAERLSALQVDSEVLKFPESYPEFNPVDIYRCFISTHLAKITGVDVKTVYPALQWTQALDKGDLNLAIPRLRVKSDAPDKLAKRWAEEVSKAQPRNLAAGSEACAITFSFPRTILSSLQPPMG